MLALVGVASAFASIGSELDRSVPYRTLAEGMWGVSLAAGGMRANMVLPYFYSNGWSKGHFHTWHRLPLFPCALSALRGTILGMSEVSTLESVMHAYIVTARREAAPRSAAQELEMRGPQAGAWAWHGVWVLLSA